MGDSGTVTERSIATHYEVIDGQPVLVTAFKYKVGGREVQQVSMLPLPALEEAIFNLRELGSSV